MRADTDDTVVHGSCLRRVMQNTHKGSRVLRLTDVSVVSDMISAMSIPAHLVVEEVLR